MAQHNEIGKSGEKLAVDYLQKKGYQILETNWRYEKTEIDIIALHENFIICIEVKTRTNLAFGLPQEFVTPAKVKNLSKALDAYMELNQVDKEARFDIVAIYQHHSGSEIEHLIDAFYYF